MKKFIRQQTLLFLGFIAFSCPALSAGILDGTFKNLGFEQATIVPQSSVAVPWDALYPISSSAALPYWTVTEDTTVCNTMWGQPVALDETSVSLINVGAGTEIGYLSAITGAYSVFMSSNSGAPSGYYKSASIAQTGQLASSAKSIHFFVSPNELPVVTLNGNVIPLLTEYDANNVKEVAGDISGFAGQTVNLAFTTPQTDNAFELDSISFSTATVPEPVSFALLGAGGLWTFRRRRMGIGMPGRACIGGARRRTSFTWPRRLCHR
jgi:hypothetical protein